MFSDISEVHCMNRFKYSVFVIALPLLSAGAMLAVDSASADSSMPAAASTVIAPEAEQPIAPDNSGVNTRDRNGENVTAMDQSNRPEDVKLTTDIRRALMDDGSLSMEAKNIKIITL